MSSPYEMGRVLLTTGGGPRARRRQRGSLGRPASARLSAICRRLFRSAGHAQLSVSSFQTLRASSQRRDRRGCATSSSCVASSSPTLPLTTIASAPRATLSLADFPSVARLLPETTSNPASRRGELCESSLRWAIGLCSRRGPCARVRELISLAAGRTLICAGTRVGPCECRVRDVGHSPLHALPLSLSSAEGSLRCDGRASSPSPRSENCHS